VILAVGCLEVEYLEGGSGGVGGAASTGGSAALGGGGAEPASELCGNGVDDDGDELTDCDDADCTTVCGKLPAGWTGFVSVRPAGCGADETLAQTAYLSARASAACECGCEAPTCGSVVAMAYGQNGCGGGVLSESLPDGSCVTVGNNGVESLRATATNTCEATTTTMPPVDATSVDLCAHDEGTCVFRLGANLDCPAGYPVSSQYHATIDDTRSCTTDGCSCSSPACGTVTLYASTLCIGGQTTLPLGTCVPQGEPAWLTFTADPNPSCAPAGAPTSSGDVTLSGPLTVCCS
jgi:hypothetical protein